MDGKSAWTSFNTPVMKDTVLTPVYADAVTIKLNPQNGASAYEIQSAKGSELPFIYDPSKEDISSADGTMVRHYTSLMRLKYRRM